MSVASRIAAGALSRVGWYVAHGFGRREYVDNFGPLGAGENYLTINALYQRGLEAYYAGQQATAGTGSGYVPDSRVPGRGAGRTNYRYTVLYTFTDPVSGRSKTLPHVIPSAYELTLAQLQDEGLGIRLPPDAPMLGKDGSDRVTTAWLLEGTDVITLERWT